MIQIIALELPTDKALSLPRQLEQLDILRYDTPEIKKSNKIWLKMVRNYFKIN